MRSSNVRVEIVETDAGGRQIAQRQRVSQALSKRRADIEAAVGEAIEVLSASVDRAPDSDGWGVSSIEGTFGISLTADASLIVSNLSAQASLQVRIVLEPRLRVASIVKRMALAQTSALCKDFPARIALAWAV